MEKLRTNPKNKGLLAKEPNQASWFGLGETKEEVIKILQDLKDHDCDVVTIGQYLQPTKMHLAVAEFVHPDVFAEYKSIGLEMGLAYVESGPLVRSSYHAERHL